MSKSTKSSENRVGMLSLSRVNISYMCSYWNVCVGRRHDSGGELSEGFFLV